MAFNVELKGRYSWERMFDIDNTSNSAYIKQEVEVGTDVFISYEDLLRSLESAPIDGLELGGGIIDVTSLRVKVGFKTSVKAVYEKISKFKTEYRKTTSKTNTYEIGAKSSLKLYRLVFTGPGVSYTTDIFSSSAPVPLPEIPIEVKGRVLPVLKDIEVVITSDSVSRPEDIIQEARGGDPDINGGYKGKYVWLRAIWTLDVSQGATGIQLVVQPEKNDDFKDITQGTEGEGIADFRYLKMLRDPQSKHRITEIALWRGENASETPKGSGQFEFETGDINAERAGGGGEYLYLCWNGKDHQ